MGAGWGVVTWRAFGNRAIPRESLAGRFLPAIVRRKGNDPKSNTFGLPPTNAGRKRRRSKKEVSTAARNLWWGSVGVEQFERLVGTSWRPTAKIGQHVWHYRDNSERDLSAT